MSVVSHPTSPLSCSVPQGSVLEPKTFSVYTEDIDDIFARHALQHHCYADDTDARLCSAASSGGFKGEYSSEKISQIG